MKQTKDGKTYMHVTFPKFKMGEEVVREIAEPPSYGMTGCLLLLFCSKTICMHSVRKQYRAHSVACELSKT